MRENKGRLGTAQNGEALSENNSLLESMAFTVRLRSDVFQRLKRFQKIRGYSSSGMAAGRCIEAYLAERGC